MKSLKEHLLDRYCDLSLHKPFLDEENYVADFPLYTLCGKLVGLQRYRPLGSKKVRNDSKLGKYYTIYNKQDLVFFGIETLHFSNVIFLVEGLFDACRISKHGYSVLSAFSNDLDKNRQSFLHCLSRPIVAVCDNDVAGRKLAKSADYVEYAENKDLGDSSEEFVLSLLKKYKGDL